MDWITGILTLVAMERIRRRYWDGWALGLVAQACWLWLIWQQRLWGLLPLCLGLIVSYSLALRSWRRDQRMLKRRLGPQSKWWYGQ